MERIFEIQLSGMGAAATIIPENPDVPPKSAAGQSRIVTRRKKLISVNIIEEAEPVNTNNIIITMEPCPARVGGC